MEGTRMQCPMCQFESCEGVKLFEECGAKFESEYPAFIEKALCANNPTANLVIIKYFLIGELYYFQNLKSSTLSSFLQNFRTVSFLLKWNARIVIIPFIGSYIYIKGIFI